MKTLRYYNGREEEIENRKLLYFGQIWDGEGDGKEILRQRNIAIEEKIIEFIIIEKNKDILETIIKITGIY